MGKPNFSLSSSDVKTILFSLSIFPALNCASTALQNEINANLCISAAEKICYRQTDFTSNEMRVIYASLQAIPLILQGEIPVDADVRAECAPYLFSANALLAKLPPLPFK